MSNNKFCIECGFELLRTAKFCEECGAKLIVSETNKPETEVTETVEEVEEEIEEVEESSSYLKKCDREPQQPKERTMQEAAAEISSEYRKERLSSYETENSSKKDTPIKTEKKKRYKHLLNIFIMVWVGLYYLSRFVNRINGVETTLFENYTMLFFTPIIVMAIYTVVKLIKKDFENLKLILPTIIIFGGIYLFFTLAFR